MNDHRTNSNVLQCTMYFKAVQLVFNSFSQFGPQLELYSQLVMSLWSDPSLLVLLNQHSEC